LQNYVKKLAATIFIIGVLALLSYTAIQPVTATGFYSNLPSFVNGHYPPINATNLNKIISSIETRRVVVHNEAELIAAINAAKTTGRGDIYLEPRTYYLAGNATLPIDISNTALHLEGSLPIVTNPHASESNPDLYFTIVGGAIIDTDGAAVFTGHDIYGAEFENLAFTDTGAVFSFGSTNVMGISFSTFRDIYAVDCDGTFMELINVQHIYAENCKSRDVECGLHLVNDHLVHSGANSVFVDFYTNPRANATGGRNHGSGIHIENANANGPTMGHMTFIRPQVNDFLGTAGTGSSFWVDGTDNNINSLTIIGGDFEGDALYSFEAEDMSSSNINIAVAFAKYAVYLGSGNKAESQNNQIYVGAVTNDAGKGLIYSTNYLNYFTGRCNDFEGVFAGTIYVAKTGTLDIVSTNPTYYGLRFNNTGTPGGTPLITVRGYPMLMQDNGIGVSIINLHGVTGKIDGEIRPDDGTNTAHRGVLCCWDAIGACWVKPDGSTFT
jgi:hypothetical protein